MDRIQINRKQDASPQPKKKPDNTKTEPKASSAEGIQRRLESGNVSQSDVMYLQRTIGNHATQNLIQRAESDAGSEETTKKFADLLQFWKQLETENNVQDDSPATESDSSGNYVNNGYTSASDFMTDYDDDDDYDYDYDYDYDDDYDDDSSGPGSLEIPASVDNREVQKYQQLKSRLVHYQSEMSDSSGMVSAIIGNVRSGVAQGTFPSVAEGMKLAFGWSQEDVDKYISGNFLKDDVTPSVTYLDEDARQNYEIKGGSSLKQGDPAEPFDTTNMFSKHSGAGFGIYVMSPGGKLYSDQHKVGLFHHSSFLAGLDTAGAGEWMVVNGTLKHITNKSGHYRPGKEQMVQTLMELKDRGVSLSNVKVTLVSGEEFSSATDFLDQNQWLVDTDDDESDYDDDESDYDDDYYEDDDDDEYIWVKNEAGYSVKMRKDAFYDDKDYYVDDDEDDEYTHIKGEDGYTIRVRKDSLPSESELDDYDKDSDYYYHIDENNYVTRVPKDKS